MLNGLLIISDVNMAVYAGDEQSLNASGPGGHCIDLIPLAALVTVDLMSLPTQRTDRVRLPPFLLQLACVTHSNSPLES